MQPTARVIVSALRLMPDVRRLSREEVSMRVIGALACLLGLLTAITCAGQGQELPTILTCTSNAKASRDYGFAERRWSGQPGHLVEPSRMFASSGTSSKTSWGQFELRDKVFSGLDTQAPTVRSITRYDKGPEQAAEFVARVVSRTPDTVFLLWTNAPNLNKVWLAAVDLTHRKVAVTHTFQGATSLGGELETLDCR